MSRPISILALGILCTACDLGDDPACSTRTLAEEPVALGRAVSVGGGRQVLSATAVMDRVDSVSPLTFEVTWDSTSLELNPPRGRAMLEFELDPASARDARHVRREVSCIRDQWTVADRLEFEVDGEFRVDGAPSAVPIVATLYADGYGLVVAPTLPVDAFYPVLDIAGLDRAKPWALDGHIFPDLLGVTRARFDLVDPDTGSTTPVAALSPSE